MQPGGINIQSTDRKQLDAISDGQGGSIPVLRYVSVPPFVLVNTPELQARVKLPVLGMSKVSVQISCDYPQGASAGEYSQLYYEIVGYRDNAQLVQISSGVVSPFYDQSNDEFWCMYESIGLYFATPNTGTSGARPIVAKYSVLVLP